MLTPVSDPMHYEPIPHDKSEWDNVPSILVKMCLNLNRYMHSTIAFMKEKHIEVRALQHDMALIPGAMQAQKEETYREIAKQVPVNENFQANIDRIDAEIAEIERRTAEEQERLK